MGNTSLVTPSKSEETRSFVLLTVFLFPVLTAGLVVAMGFIIWIYQMFAGPPTGPLG